MSGTNASTIHNNPEWMHAPRGEIYIPDGSTVDTALTRATHLAIGAHQDDLEIMAQHGIEACYKNEDQHFVGMTVTDGGGSPRGSNTTDEAMQDIRAQEQRTAADIGCYSAMVQTRYPSSAIKEGDADVMADLLEVLKRTRPEVIYLHNPADKHHTHVALLSHSIQAIREYVKDIPIDQRPTVYGCEVWRGLDWLTDSEDKTVLPINNLELAEKLLGAFESQNTDKHYDAATLGRWVANATYAESHAVNDTIAAIYAMDLAPLMNDCSLTLNEFIKTHLDRMADSILSLAGKCEMDRIGEQIAAT